MGLHPRAVCCDGMLVIEEMEKVLFVLEPAPDRVRHRIFVGNVPLRDLISGENATGRYFGGPLIWPEHAYFESARGQTKLLVEAQPEGSNSEEWVPVVTMEVVVLPTKIGERQYERMTDDLQSISRELLTDLYGKSRRTYDLRYAQEGRAYSSRVQELTSITRVLDRLSKLLPALDVRPATRVLREPCQLKYWGGERLSPSAIAAACRNGVSLHNAERPIVLWTERKVVSFDIPEHRLTRAFLGLVARRARYCAEAAQTHIASITADRHLRHFPRGSEPSLFESIDLPKIRRLGGSLAAARRAVATARALAGLPFLRNVEPAFVAVNGATYQRSPEYVALLSLMRHFLLENAVWYNGAESSVVTKLTSRLFEQWCFLRVVEAFRQSGLELREWSEALRQNLRTRFILDFDRGLAFEGELFANLRIRFRYEPWILGKESAISVGETLCRGSSDVAWSPDIVIECCSKVAGAWQPFYVIVMDCKYRRRIQTFEEVEKYSQIRATASMRQVVKQLWLITPVSQDTPSGIQSDDPAVQFNDSGPTCPVEETVRFRLSASPEVDSCQENVGTQHNCFQTFARGTVSLLRRFAAGGPS